MTTITAETAAQLIRWGFKVHSRKDWGSKTGPWIYKTRRTTKPVPRGAGLVVQHLTDTRPSGDFRGDCRMVEAIGNARFGAGVSYNWLVDASTGHIAVGMPLDAKGTHTRNTLHTRPYGNNLNSVGRAIAVIGTVETPVSSAAVWAIAGILAAMESTGATAPDAAYLPHHHFARKACPGPRVDAHRGEVLELAETFRQVTTRDLRAVQELRARYRPGQTLIAKLDNLAGT